MKLDTELPKHCPMLLGLNSPWEVQTVELKLEPQKVEIQLDWQWGSAAPGPECGRECSIHDGAPERPWRHLDTMQFETILQARVPRSRRPDHGVQTIRAPWAAPHGRFPRRFERFGVEVLLASSSVSQACTLPGIGWDAVHQIMQRAVARA